MPLLFSLSLSSFRRAVLAFKWWIAYWSKRTDLLVVQGWKDGTVFVNKKVDFVDLRSWHLYIPHKQILLRLLSDDFLWVKKVFNFLASFVFRWWCHEAERGEEKMKQHWKWARWRKKKEKKSWNYDDLIRKVRNNEIFLMRNFFSSSVRLFHGLCDRRLAKVICCVFTAVGFFLHYSRPSRGKDLMKSKKGGIEKGNLSSTGDCGRKTTLVDVLFNEGGIHNFTFFLRLPSAQCSFTH